MLRDDRIAVYQPTVYNPIILQHRGENMSATTWKAVVRLPNGNQQEVRVMADSQINARQMIEAQYGRGSIIFGVHKVDLTRW